MATKQILQQNSINFDKTDLSPLFSCEGIKIFKLHNAHERLKAMDISVSNYAKPWYKGTLHENPSKGVQMIYTTAN